ncbi:hypothetical protein C8R44DRAFT_755395 [Mycena epipterygia]|nr:hypothetical protein C8R44DRAFT_755395 [Mycena epipterygia]
MGRLGQIFDPNPRICGRGCSGGCRVPGAVCVAGVLRGDVGGKASTKQTKRHLVKVTSFRNTKRSHEVTKSRSHEVTKSRSHENGADSLLYRNQFGLQHRKAGSNELKIHKLHLEVRSMQIQQLLVVHRQSRIKAGSNIGYGAFADKDDHPILIRYYIVGFIAGWGSTPTKAYAILIT